MTHISQYHVGLMSKSRIWTNYAPLLTDPSPLLRLLPDYPVVVGTKSGDDPSLAQSDIAFGQPQPSLVIELTSLKWIHVNTAGYTPYDREDVRAALRRRRAPLTNSSSVYAEPCAQHALSMILSLARNLPHAVVNQHGPRAWPMNHLRGHSRVLTGQTALLIGFGSIGKRLAELLAPLRMNVIALRRTVQGNEPIQTHPMSSLDDLLPQADHVINILPAAESTRQLFNRTRFGKMKGGSIFYNIGRGDTVDQPALMDALKTEHLSAAFLDVMTPEPLPPEHPLWTTPNCHITPHTAGGHHDEIERVVGHFVDNLRRFERGQAMVDRIF